MENIAIENKMYQMAIELIESRYPVGWGGAAVIHTANDNYYSSVALETANGSAQLCIEVGAMCDAHKFNEKVTHCLCVVRDDEKSSFKVLSPCGICQERLRYWGKDVLVGVTTSDHQLKFIELSKLQPHHWSDAYPAEELEHFEE
ncbi:cytidine deaminase [Anaerorhabdus furcosa]|uniref:Cytidine deaminase n=1 Tax=Anaerorhabdus furcosa TaxID=118967 RepID=A0A1T4PVU7_9FIRM|nr:cytidine deaminase [Anaerorhabdus furcosa]SJZ95645.1 cytidine deaminase [Anaerorhabdus furcosa]